MLDPGKTGRLFPDFFLALQCMFFNFSNSWRDREKCQTLFSKIAKTCTRLISDIFLSLSFSGRRGRGDRDLRLAVDGRLVGHRHRHTAILTLCLLQGQLLCKRIYTIEYRC